MKSLPTFLIALMLSAAPAPAALFSSGDLNTVIPDGNPAGIASTINVSGMGLLADVNVFINVSGGFNGDLYAYLTYDNGSVVLLNRMGKTGSDPFGSATAGFNFTFDDTGSLANIHGVGGSAGSPVTGSYHTDGRTTDPQLVMDSDTPGVSLDSFNGSSPNGNWTIYFADMAGGNDPSTLVNWSLEITPVPEPVNVALGIFAGGFVLVSIGRTRGGLRRLHRWRVAAVHWVDAF